MSREVFRWPRVPPRRSRTWTPALLFLSAIGRFKHGTIGAYQLGCPCDPCRHANVQKQRERRGGGKL